MKEKRQEILSQMEVGMILEGIVKNVTEFGAFVDLGGIDGLLHITDITWGRINHPSERISLGEKIKVKVIDFDVKNIKISLGMKQLEENPWTKIESKYSEGTKVEGKVIEIGYRNFKDIKLMLKNVNSNKLFELLSKFSFASGFILSTITGFLFILVSTLLFTLISD